MLTPKPLRHSPFIPYDPDISTYNSSFGHLTPWEYAGWKKESLSWKEGCYLHAGLNPNFRNRLTGPGALQLLKDACINDFSRFSIGASKHGVMCNAQGNTMADGMLLRTGEEEFENMGHGPYIDYLARSGRYDVKLENLDEKTFLFQVAGPRSLEVVEALTGESLRDVEFLWHRPSRVPQPGLLTRDIQVRIYRLGVARTLAYEVHGDIADAQTVYAAIMKAGEPLGIERLGIQAYGMNHTEGGFAQSFIHFLHAWTEDGAFMQFLGDNYHQIMSRMPGSAGPDVTKRYANPVELGWGHMLKFDHEFVGRAALEAAVANPRRKIVTLEWNEADILDVYASQFRPGGDIEFMDFASNPIWQGYLSRNFADDVLLGETLVGMSSGRMFSYYYKKMISLALLNVAHADLGTEVNVLWGEPGTRQKRIRAVVSRFPYIDLPFNNDIDTHTPH